MSILDVNELFELHEKLWHEFKKTADIEYFKAAKACARQIMDYEERMGGYNYHFLLSKMYGRKD